MAFVVSNPALAERETVPVPLTYYEMCLVHEGLVRLFRAAKAAWTPAQPPLSAPYLQILQLSQFLCNEVSHRVQKERVHASPDHTTMIPLSLQELELVLGGLDLYRKELLIAETQVTTKDVPREAFEIMYPFSTVAGKLALLVPLVKCLKAHKAEQEAWEQERPEAVLMALGAQLLWHERPGTDKVWISQPLFSVFSRDASENVNAEFYIVWRNGPGQFICRRIGKSGKSSCPMPCSTPSDAKAACERHHTTGEWR